jgi:hypothetical protein
VNTMAVKKFRSIEAMGELRREAWCDQPDAAYFERVGRLWELSSRISPRTFPRGVYKFRTLEEAQAQRDALLTEHVQLLWRDRIESGALSIVQQGRPISAEKPKSQ